MGELGPLDDSSVAVVRVPTLLVAVAPGLSLYLESVVFFYKAGLILGAVASGLNYGHDGKFETRPAILFLLMSCVWLDAAKHTSYLGCV